MEKRISNRSMGKLMAAAAVGLAGFATAQQADASVVIDVRATQLNGAPVADPKNVAVSAAGDVVTFQIFATVTGTNGLDDEGFQAINGAIRSSTGGLLGNLTGTLAGPTFTGNGSSVGSIVDIDSDGDLDVSGTNPAVAGGYWNPRNAAGFSTDGTRGLDGNSETFLIGGATWTAGDVASGGQTVVDYLQHRNSSGGNNLAWGTFLEDNNSAGTHNPTNTPISTTGGVLISVPEPSGLALAGLGVLGLLARRKKNA